MMNNYWLKMITCIVYCFLDIKNLLVGWGEGILIQPRIICRTSTFNYFLGEIEFGEILIGDTFFCGWNRTKVTMATAFCLIFKFYNYLSML